MTFLAAHADWSVSPGKRWMSVASPCGRVWTEPVGEVGTLLARLRALAGSAPIALGVDAPVGVPAFYAEAHLAAYRDFPAFLASLRPDDPFFEVCREIDEVGAARPFYPHSARGEPRRLTHATRLGADHADALLRRCDRKTTMRPRAAPLFWTLGPNQVGKAALSLWRELLPTAPSGCLWPFHGPLARLMRERGCAIAETYPAEAMRQLGLFLPGSKRRQANRATLADGLFAAMDQLGVTADDALSAGIVTGFGADPAGEDRFDSLVGLLGLLLVIREPARDVFPSGRFEGWILGQALDDLRS